MAAVADTALAVTDTGGAVVYLNGQFALEFDTPTGGGYHP